MKSRDQGLVRRSRLALQDMNNYPKQIGVRELSRTEPLVGSIDELIQFGGNEISPIRQKLLKAIACV